MAVLNLTENDFSKEVLEASLPVLVDFWAPWCGPCRAIAPIIESIEEELSGAVKVCKVNVDDFQDLAVRYDVMNIPTIVLFKNGEPVKRLKGLRPKAEILDMING